MIGASLAARLNRPWRVVATGFAFVVYGLSALVVGVPIAFVLRRVSPDEATCQRRVQLAIQYVSYYFMRMLEALGIMRMRLEGVERLAAPGQLIVCNHPTLLDAVAVLGFTPRAVCVTKIEHWHNPVMRAAVVSSGYIPNRGGNEVVDACVGRLREGTSLILFPEGTRTPRDGGGKVGHFQRGAAHVALRSGCDIVPVVIRCDPPTLGKGRPWYDVPSRPFDLHVRVEAPIAVGDFQRSGLPIPRAARQLNSALTELFEKRLDGVGA